VTSSWARLHTEPNVHKERGKMKDSNKNYQNYIHRFHNKESVLAESLTAADGTSGFPEA
jgi:hypothetical protein